MPDFTNCKRLPGYAYNGANGKKLAIEYHGERYVLKFPSSNRKNLSGSSQPNSCINEHIASTIFNMAGISAQETLLGDLYRGKQHEDRMCLQGFYFGRKQTV